MNNFNPFVVGVVSGPGPVALRPLALESMELRTAVVVADQASSVFDTVPGVAINADHLRQAVARVVGTVSKRDTFPILHHVLIEGAATGDRLTLTTTDLDTATRATIPATGCVAGFAACVPAATLSDWLARVPKGAALILDTLGVLSYTKANGCKSRLELIALPAEDFPNIPSVTAGRLVECNAAAFGLALSAVLPYASKDQYRECLNGVYMAAGLNGLTFTGCDTYRMKVETVAAFMPVGELTAGAGESITAILPAAVCKALAGACKAAGPDADLTLRVESDSEGADRIGVELNGVEIFARVMSGALYPEAPAKVAADFAPVLTFEVDRAAFAKQLQAIGGKFNAAGVVEFDFTRGGDFLELHGYSDDGARSVEAVALISAGGATSCEVFGVSAKFLFQALPVVKATKKPVKGATVAPLLIEVAANSDTGAINSVRLDGSIIYCHETRAQAAAKREAAAAELVATEAAERAETLAKIEAIDVVAIADEVAATVAAQVISNRLITNGAGALAGAQFDVATVIMDAAGCTWDYETKATVYPVPYHCKDLAGLVWPLVTAACVARGVAVESRFYASERGVWGVPDSFVAATLGAVELELRRSAIAAAPGYLKATAPKSKRAAEYLESMIHAASDGDPFRAKGVAIESHNGACMLARQALLDAFDFVASPAVKACTVDFATSPAVAVAVESLDALPVVVEVDGAAQAAARILDAEKKPVPVAVPVGLESLDAAQIGAVERVAAYVAELKARHSDRATKLEKSFAWQVGEISNVIEFHANKGRDAWRALEIWERGAMAAAAKKVTA